MTCSNVSVVERTVFKDVTLRGERVRINDGGSSDGGGGGGSSSLSPSALLYMGMEISVTIDCDRDRGEARFEGPCNTTQGS